MAVYENFTRITSADTWAKVAEIGTGFTLDFDYIVMNADAGDAQISLAVAANDAAPASDTEHYIQADVAQNGVVTGSELIGPARALYVKSNQTDTRVRISGISEAV